MSGYNYNVITLDVSSGLNDLKFEYDGERIVYLSGNVTLYVKLWSNSNDAIPLNPKNALNAKFKEFYLTCDPDTHDIVLLIAKPADFIIDVKQIDVDTITNVLNIESLDKVDEVSLIDKSIADYYRSYNDKNTYGWSYKVGSLTGYYSYASFLNPSGSGVKSVIQRLMVQNDGTGAQDIKILDGTPFTTTGNLGSNKYLGSPIANSKIIITQSTTDYSATYPVMFWNGFDPLDTMEFIKHDAFVLSEGESITVQAMSTGIGFYLLIEWIEI